MPTPKSLMVFGTKYALRRCQKLREGNLYGLCDTEKKEIRICSKLRGKQYMETLIHEFCHAVFHECSLNQAVSSEVEEIVVDLISRSLVENQLTPFRGRKRVR